MTFYWFGWLVTGSKFFAIKFKDRVLLLFIFVIYRHLYAHLHACFSYANHSVTLLFYLNQAASAQDDPDSTRNH